MYSFEGDNPKKLAIKDDLLIGGRPYRRLPFYKTLMAKMKGTPVNRLDVTNLKIGTRSNIKGLQFLVVDATHLFVNQTTGPSSGCKAEIKWALNVCKGCACKHKGKDAIIDHRLSITLAEGGTKCSTGTDPWLPKIDRVFRTYQAQLRAQLGALKSMCCTPGIQGSRFDEAMVSNKEFAKSIKGQTKLVCNGESGSAKEPKIEKASQFAVQPPEPHEDWTDVTGEYISRLKATCTEHAYIGSVAAHGFASVPETNSRQASASFCANPV